MPAPLHLRWPARLALSLPHAAGLAPSLQAMLFLAPVFSPFIIGVFSILCTSLAHVCPKTDSDLPFLISNNLCILSHILE